MATLLRMVQVAFANDAGEAELIRGLLAEHDIPCFLQQVGINGPMVGEGLLTRSAQRVMVNPEQADAARRVIEGAKIEGEMGATPEIANAAYLETGSGGGPRDYNVFGAYARAILWSVAAMGLFAGAFLLLRAV
jgi:hypothetical protein